MKLRNVITATVMVGLLAACSLPRQDLTSPCAGTEGSPCGPHRPINDWWMNPGAQDGQNS